MRSFTVALVCAALGASCAGVHRPEVRQQPAPPGASIWKAPTDLASRDLYLGPWGAEFAPDPNDVYELVEVKHSGVNLGMTVKDSKGREWSVKQPYPGNLDSEAPVEVALSRLLSGIGYHQPPVYHLQSFTLKDDFGKRVETGGRFRPKIEELDEVSDWDWADNPFVGTREYQGLIVLLMLFNSTDLKNSNNSLYEYRDGDLVEQWYVTRDLGAALGDTERWVPRKNHPASFEKVPFVVGVENGFVRFAYTGWYQNLVRQRITPEEVAWACNLLGRLSDAQMRDAFRAANYQPEIANRFIARIREKIQQGRSLPLAAERN